MDRNQRSRNQKKSVPPRKGQPSHRNTKSAPPQRSSRPAGSQQPVSYTHLRAHET